jgi:hypothetical protein
MKIFFCILLANILYSKINVGQTIYNYSIAQVIESMPDGTRLPDGTIVKAEIITTGNGVAGTNMGRTGVGLGGVYDGNALSPKFSRQ